VTPCSLVIIYCPRGWKRCSQSRRKFLQFAWMLLYFVWVGLPTASSGPAPNSGTARGNERKRKGQRSTYDGCWPQMPSTKQINTKLQLILSRKKKTICNIFGHPSPIPDFHVPVIRTGFFFPLDGSVRWRVALCSAVGGIDRTGSSNSALVNHVRLLNI